MRIVQLANAYGASSGGLRTAVDTLGSGYAAAGHERMLVVPGRQWQVQHGCAGLTVTVPAMAVGGGYRMILRTGSVERLLERLDPDVIEVSDKYTLTAVADWAARRGVGTVLFSHERLDAIVPARLPRAGANPPARAAIRAWNQRVASRFDAVVVTSAFAEGEFRGLGVRSLRRVTLGVDLDLFRPRGQAARSDARRSGSIRLAYAGRLSPEKNVGLAIATVRVLSSAGHPAVLDVYGTGPALPELRRLAINAPVRFHGHVADRAALADHLAAADLVLAPCLVETFGLAVLEALACATPVVAAAGGAAGELLGEAAGLVAPPTAAGMAEAVLALLARPEAQRRAAARSQAERHPWSRAVAEMLAVHTAVTLAAARRRGDRALIAA
ncbi:glycosyltransferase [Actinospica durhamensis]|uniref:Glycosyltransferase n=1 Tax=Actinospica durhamensis TaxID=1508375 RepID=A0A941EUP0_9ACTN|nr:glycosyltransferase [Actinospica durhamensis]MBR7837336.1 glycosyltransferase [Actinospica durhamensis]